MENIAISGAFISLFILSVVAKDLFDQNTWYLIIHRKYIQKKRRYFKSFSSKQQSYDKFCSSTTNQFMNWNFPKLDLYFVGWTWVEVAEIYVVAKWDKLSNYKTELVGISSWIIDVNYREQRRSFFSKTGSLQLFSLSSPL